MTCPGKPLRNKTSHPMHRLYGVIFMKHEKNNGLLSAAFLCGILCAGAGMLTRFWAGPPYQGLHQMGIAGLVLPVWLMSLLWLLWYFALGAVCGAVLAKYGACSVAAWRGTVFFILMLGSGFLWYPLFFCRQAVGLCLLLTLALLLLCILCALNWQQLSLAAGAVVYLHSLWLVYMLILQLVCVFHT